MKFRNDFVTNSSSSCFTVHLKLELANDETIGYVAGGATVTVSPRQLGQAENVRELIALLEKGVVSRGHRGDISHFGPDMDCIVWITLEAEQYRYGYNASFTYDRTTGVYEGYQFRERSDGDEEVGELLLEDLALCKILYDPWQSVDSPSVLELPVLNADEEEE